MQGDGDLVEIALPIDAGGVDELLVLGHALGRLELFVEEGAEGGEIDVEDAVGFGKQARGLGRRLGAQKTATARRRMTPATIKSVRRVRLCISAGVRVDRGHSTPYQHIERVRTVGRCCEHKKPGPLCEE